MTTIEYLRIITFTSSLAGMLILIGVAYCRKDKWLYTVPPFLLLINTAMFSGLRTILGPLTPDLAVMFNLWATVILLQLAFTIIGIGGVYLWLNRS